MKYLRKFDDFRTDVHHYYLAENILNSNSNSAKCKRRYIWHRLFNQYYINDVYTGKQMSEDY